MDATQAGGSLGETLAGEGGPSSSPQPPSSQPSSAVVAADASDAQPKSGAKVGRYIVLEKLGQGAMGVVWSAWDPELDRRVALKLLKHKRGRGADEHRLRLQREAQALAKLSHPNVVAVYDVGIHNDQLFVAMEHVDGKTVGKWVQDDNPSAGERIAALLAAGEGLAAAHASGLVHRDFKPENVMIDGRGRVRVMDFGLARQSDGGASGVSVTATLPQDVGLAREGSSHSSDTTTDGVPRSLAGSVVEGAPRSQMSGSGSQRLDITVAGSLVGTPAYMSPEQFEGAPADARSDQFSFCVTAWEVLVGKRPFAGESIAAIAFAASQGTIESPPAASMLDAARRRALERGLRADPTQRWPDMKDLLRELGDRVPTRRRAWPIVALAIVAGGAAVGYAQLEKSRIRGACASADVQLAGTWDAAARAQLKTGFEASASPLAQEMVGRVEESLDRWATAWVETAQPLCLGESKLPSQLALPQARCLANARAEVDALLSVLHHADAEAVRRSLDNVQRLPDPARCGDTIYLSAAVKPPPAAIADAVTRLEGEVRLARAERVAGAGAAAQVRVEAVLKEIDETGYAPLRYAAHLEHARLLEASKQRMPAFDEAVLATKLAVEGGDSEGAAMAAMLAAGTIRGQREFDATTDVLMELATAHGTASGNGFEFQRERTHTRGAIDYARAKNVEAKESFLQELALLEGRDNTESLKAGTYLALSAAERGLGDLEAAEQAALRAQELYEKAYPPTHPLVASAIDRRGAIAYERGDIVGARAKFEQALELYLAALGPAHPETVNERNNIAGMMTVMGELEAAEAMYKDVLEGLRAKLQPDDAEVGTALCNLAMAASNLDRNQEAIELYQQGLPILEKSKGADHPDIAWIAVNYATALRASGDLEQAAQWGQRSVEIRETRLGPEHPHLAMALHGLADTRLAQGQLEAARDLASRALAIWEKVHGPSSGQLIAGIATLAEAHQRLGDHKTAAELAQRGLDILEASPVKTPGKQAHLHSIVAAARLSAGDVKGALTGYEQALTAAGDEPSLQRGEANEYRAQVLLKLGRRADAIASMKSALADYETQGPGRAAWVERAQAWLATHGG